MLELLLIGAIALFGFKKGIALVAEGFAKGILLAIGLLGIGLILLCVLV